MIHKQIELNVNYDSVGAVQGGPGPRFYSYLLDESPELRFSHKRPAMIVCPGGGYEFTSDREAECVAMRYLAAGIHAFVLRYSVAPSRYPSAVLELAAAVAHVRAHAEEYCVDPERIYISGFSAGGHLCATLGTLWNEPVFEKAFAGTYDPSQEKPWKPNGMVLSYPVITMGDFTHKGSRVALLGPDCTQEQIQEFSLENRVSKDTVPTFIWHTQEDDAVPVENTLMFAMALQKNSIPYEMHIFEHGWHGLSLCDETSEGAGGREYPRENGIWIDLAIKWIKRK